MNTDFSTASSVSRPRNIVISGTNFWNPGDDFVRDGIIRVLRELFPATPLNFLFYNFNADFFPQDKFSGIGNYVSKGDLDQYRDSIDDVVIAGLSAGDEIKDLYRWVIANRLEDKVLLIGAGYENAYVADHVLVEPEATIFRKARLVIGRTEKTPAFVRQTGVPYIHLNCPAILSVPEVKKIPAGQTIHRIGFSIQLPHGEGIANHSCAREQYELSLAVLRDLSQRYQVEVIAHHKTEYFHFLRLLSGENIPVIFSSFYQDLHALYPRYDLVITTRLHSSLFANGHGIPGIIINDTDRHTHTLEGFSHSTWVNNRDSFQRVFKKLCERNLEDIARESHLFKRELLEKYVSALSSVFNVNVITARTETSVPGFSPTLIEALQHPDERSNPKPCVSGEENLPIHFFTIVLNGQPFIQHHIDVLRRLPFQWHWHIVEGVAELNHDTGWSKATGGQIPAALHRNGLSIDGTIEYLDTLLREFPANVTLYRPATGKFWDGKRAMVNAPLANIQGECLLWQIDADELWTESQIIRARAMFLAHPGKTAALFFCHYFVGPDLVITSRDTYGNNSSYEWLRVWRHQAGDRWLSHEPPRLGRQINGAQPLDVAALNSFTHAETEAMGLVFQHFAYATEAQVEFKEKYYGYPSAVAQWRRLQNATTFPQRLADHFEWVKDEAVANTSKTAGIHRLAPDAWFNGQQNERFSPLQDAKRILFVRTDSIGDAVLASSMLKPIRQKCPQAKIAVLCQQHVAELFIACPFVDSIICFDRKSMEVSSEREQIISEIAAFHPDVILNSVRSRDQLSNALSQVFRDARHIAIEGDLSNISEADHAQSHSGYKLVISSPGDHKLELERHSDFLAGLGLNTAPLRPVVWTTPESEALGDAFFQDQKLDPSNTIALFPGAQHEIRVYPKYAEALQEFANVRFLIFGDASQLSLANELAAQLGERAINLCGRTTISETAAILRRCRLYIGAESAGAHIACAVGVPNIVILGGGHFGRFMPYSSLTSAVALPLECYGCNWNCPHSHAHCVKDISSRVLAEAIRQTLAQPSSQPRLFIQASHDWTSGSNLPAWKRPDPFLNGMDVNIIEVGSIVESNELTPEAQQQVDRAQAALDRGNVVDAVASLEAARKLCPRHADVLIALGNLHFQLGNLSASAEALQLAAELRRHDPLVHVLLATVLVRLERMPEFEHAISRALELDNAFAPAHRLLADLNLEAGRYADAAREYGILLQQNPNDIPVLLALGKCLNESGEIGASEECFARVLQLDPANEIAKQNLNVLRSRPRHPGVYNSAATTHDPSIETIGCPFCQSRNAEQVRRSADIVRCSDCRTVYLRTRPKKEVMERIYQNYADDGSHMALPKSFAEADRSGLKRDYFLKEILQFTKPDGLLLDVGCGWGAFLLNARQHGFQVAGHEITRKAAGYANDSLQIPVKTSQFLETDYAPGTQSVVTMLHVFEHLPYPKEALDKVFQVLKPGGMFCGIVPNFDSFCSQTLGEQWFWLDPNYHYVHYTPATMRKHLEAAGFIVERIYTNTGDYGSEPIKELLAQQNQTTAAPSVFGERLKRIENEGRGEEIRFFARKPARTQLVESTEIIRGENFDEPLVSVVVSTFNAEHFLRPCLENLTRQTIFSQIEVIVVDSGSEQNERAIALEFIGKHSNIHYVRSNRETIYDAWNRGLAFARGRYWANLNTDDSLRDDALAILVAALEAHPDCALAYGDTAWTTKSNDRFPSSNIVKTVKYPDYAPVETLFYCITGCLQFWRTDSIRQLGGFDASLSCAGDYEATLKMMTAGMNAIHVPEVLSLFFQNTAGLSQSSNRGELEHGEVMNRYRAGLDIAKIFQVKPGQPSSIADALAMLGAHATSCSVPWEKTPVEHMDFAFACFHKALEIDPENVTAGMNLIVTSQKLERLDPDTPDLVRRWPKMREWISNFRKGVHVKLPFVTHAVQGPIYRPSEWNNRPTAAQLAKEPKSLRPWICRIDGRHVYLSEELFSRPAGLRYYPEELEAAARRLASLMTDLPPFYAHFGGAGDALVLLASFYDQHPNGVVFSHPNNVGATTALFDAFPKISKIYFLPQHTEPFFHIILRYTVRELRNCRGAGATPREGYDTEWKAGLDIEKKYGIKKSPRWAADMKQNANSRRIAVAPKGSMAGMVGSKRNIILPELWPQIIAHILERGFEPVILGLPSEANEYPVLPGCIDARGESFSGQIQRIGESVGLVGADSWAKTFSALAEIPTLVFEPLKGADLAGWKDPSDWIFIEPWPAIKMVGSLDEFRQAFDSRIAGTSNVPLPTSAKTVVAWEGSFLDFGSLSHVNRELSHALADSDSVRLHCVNSPTQPKNVATPKALKKLATTLAKKSSTETQVTIRHAWPPDWQRPAQGKLVVIQPWEFGSLPQAWVEASKNVDEFWVPSNYVRNVYVESGIEANKVVVVPNGIDPEKFHAKAKPLTLATKKKFKFLFVGGTIFRKGPDVLLKAYLETFTAADDVCLVIKDFGGQSVYAGQTIESQIRAAQTKPNAPEILYLNDELPPESLPGLYTACDCFVLPYRGEGFGLPVLEAMACGLPVVITAGGSTDDFVRDDFAFRISATRTIFGNEISSTKLVAPGWLLEPNVVELGEKMRWIFRNPSEVSERGRRASNFAHQNFTWKNSAEIAAGRIRELAARPNNSPAPAPISKPLKAAGIVLPACAKVGQLSEARELLKKKQHRAAWEMTLAAIQSRPFHPEGFLLLAEVALAAGDSVSARRCAQYARDLAPDWKPAKQFLKGNLRGNSKLDWMVLPEGRAEVPRLSVCLIAKNEERFIGQCLASVRGLAHQIVVVDTGSTDRTVEIAKENGAEIYQFAWNDDFSAARNAALEHVTGDWLLVLDADEELLPEHRETILKEMQADAIMAYRLPIIDKGKEQDGCSYVPRLFRNAPGLFFVGRVHEQIFSSVEVRCQEWGLKNQLGKTALLHHGYTQEMVVSRDKIARNLKLLQQAIVEFPGEPNLLMSLGLELVRSKQLAAGLEKYREALHIMAQMPPKQIVPELRETLLTQLSTHLMAAKRFTEIEQLWETPFAKSASMTASQHFLLGLAHIESKRAAEAAEQMRLCLSKRHLPTLSPIHSEILKAGPNHCLALALASLKQNVDAEKAFRAALVDDPQSRSAKFDFARFQVERGESLEAFKLLHELISENPDELMVWEFGGKIALSQPDFLEFACDWTGEALKHFPEHSRIIVQRAEALLLSGEAEAALPLWQKVQSPRTDRHVAALLLCQSLGGKTLERFSSSEEDSVSREFLNWYRQLIKANAVNVVCALNERIQQLRNTLPTFVNIWETAAKQAAEISN